MASGPRVGRPPVHLGLVVAFLLIIGTMSFLIIGSWLLSDGLNGRVIDHTNPYVHFSETNAQQEITDGIIELFFGTLCFIVFLTLFFTRRKFLFPP